jgi:glyceraldehyde 3-phosphate dehydrogenase
MALRIAINGFGRIGRMVCRLATRERRLSVVAVRDLAEAPVLAHLLAYDSVYGQFALSVSAGAGSMSVAGQPVAVVSGARVEGSLWRDLGVDLVVEATGACARAEQAEPHLEAGARWVLVTAVVRGADATVVRGVNDRGFDPAVARIVSNASCTTHCLAPLARVLNEQFGIERGFLTTVHPVTNEQTVLDGPGRDPRMARSALSSIIPVPTGAAKALGMVVPELEGRLDGLSVRVPTAVVSLLDLTFASRRPMSAEAVNSALRFASHGPLKGVLEVCDEPLVSPDFKGHPASCIVDALSTRVSGERLGKVLAWYDNEFAYASRCVELLRVFAAHREALEIGPRAATPATARA